MTTTTEEALIALAERLAPGCQCSAGTGTRASHAQILAPWIRRWSFYAVAETEEKALELAVAELERAVRAQSTTLEGDGE